MPAKTEVTPIGITIIELTIREDARGSSLELFRADEFANMGYSFPKMGYMSLTRQGVRRGPHEHETQTDYFIFMGPSQFRLEVWKAVWDQNEKKILKESYIIGHSRPCAVIIPPGIVHAYTNISPQDGRVLNFPDVLYAGVNKLDPVDEIRWENVEANPYQ